MPNSLIEGTDRCAVLFERIGPYHFARLSALAGHIKTVGIELFGMDETYAWRKCEAPAEFSRITLAENAGCVGSRELVNRLLHHLERLRPSFVAVPGWMQRTSLAALQWCLATNTPAIVMSASSAVGKNRSAWREIIKEQVVRLFSAGLGGGAPHVEYLQSLGLESHRVFPGYNVVDNEYFAKGAEQARVEAATLRQALQLPQNYFLCVARFIPEKNLIRLLHSYAAYRMEVQADAWDLVLLGDGPLKTEIHHHIEDLQLTKHVQLPGFKQIDQLPKYYGLASAFVLPSVSETWGLVVNEAMASGLPVIVSNHCGCARDLVKDKVNGFTFNPHDKDRLRQCLIEISHSDRVCQSMGQESRRLIAQWPLDAFALNMMKAASAAQAKPRSKTPLTGRWILNALIRK